MELDCSGDERDDDSSLYTGNATDCAIPIVRVRDGGWECRAETPLRASPGSAKCYVTCDMPGSDRNGIERRSEPNADLLQSSVSLRFYD